MSRIIVKNLPKNITEQKVRNIFGEKGLLTDIQLKYTPEGKFRQFAFIGYQNESDATAAIKHFNNTCIQTNKISVAPCATLGDVTKPKAWSKYAPDSNAYKKKKPKNEKDAVTTEENKNTDKKEINLLEKYKNDPLFEEFMEVHTVKLPSAEINSATTTKDNDPDSGVSETNSDTETIDEKESNLQMTDLEYMKSLKKNAEKKPRQEKKVKEKIDLYTLKLRNLPYKCKKKDIKQFFNPNTPYSIRIPRNIKGIAYVGFKNEKQLTKGLLKNKSIILGKSIQVIKYAITDLDKEDPKFDKQAKWKTQEEGLKNEEDIAESGRIFIRNLSYTTTEDEIENLFSKFGPIAEVILPVDKFTSKPKGFGIITFVMPEHAVKAYAELDGSILHGRMLHLLPGIAKESEIVDDDSTNYKKKKERKEKSRIGLSHNWNSLFIGHDAVAEIIADTYGTTKKNVLDPHDKSSAAVRLALGETQIVATTRKYLEQEGVVLDAFSGPIVKRSKTIILVKNLAANTEVKELYDLFKPHGNIGRIILPPSGITAIVEFMEPSEAKRAFLLQGFKKFKNLPLYLEWAPENTLKAEKEIHKDHLDVRDAKTHSKSGEAIADIKPTEEVSKEDSEEETPEEDTTLFVKNLNFETTDDSLKQHFEECGKISYATVAMKKDKTNPAKRLSMGYGFVRFMHKSAADKALKTLQQSTLDGKSLELKRSERILKNDVSTSRKITKKTKQTGTKILVRNVPFQATLKEIQELFKSYGEIKALRLPKKMTPGANSHRGFAFVDFVTISDAKAAFEALSQSTHLFGRRLVLEWASTEEGVEEIRKRTADHFHNPDEVKSKKSVFSIE